MTKLLAGIVLGFMLAAMLAPWNAARRDSSKTETCESGRFPFGKKWECTPAEKAALAVSEGQ